MPRTSLLVVLWLSLAFGGPRARAEFLIPDWAVGVIVDDGFAGLHDTRIFANLPSPFQGGHTAAVGSSSSSAEYLLDWSTQHGSFSISASQVAEDVSSSSLYATAAGGFTVDAFQNDVTITTSGTYTYNTPATYFGVTLKLLVYRLDPWEVIWGANEHGGPFGGYPPSGTLEFSGSATIPAGDIYVISYRMEVLTFGGGPGVLGTGAGEINFELHSVPEPATAALLLLAAALGFPRRISRRQTSQHSIPHHHH